MEKTETFRHQNTSRQQYDNVDIVKPSEECLCPVREDMNYPCE